MANKYTEEQKFQVIAKFECGEDNREIVEVLGIAYPTVLKWRHEWKEAKAVGDIQSLVNVDSLLIHRVAEEIKQDMQQLSEPTVIEHTKPTDSEVVEWAFQSALRKPVERETPVEYTQHAVLPEREVSLVDKIDSYQMLSVAMHATALKLVDKISLLSDKENTGPMELGTLVESLSRIQVAFFNKNSTNVNILNQQVVSEKEVSTFKAFKKA